MKGFLFLLCGLALSPAYALDIKLTECQKLNAQITDIEFLTESQFFVSAKTGDLYLSEGCKKEAEIIKHLDVRANSELGLLGVAIGEKSSETKKQSLFLYYSPESSDKTRTRLSVFDFIQDGKNSQVVAEKKIMEIVQPYQNHDGGALKIGPDGNLYLGVGDGGSGGDPYNHGQNVRTVLASIVRIRPDSSSPIHYKIPKGNLQDFVKGAAPEILAYGLRNPWKFTFDSLGNLIVADVGQNKFEEISVVAAANIGTKVLNFGWPIKEGRSCFKSELNCKKEDLVEPIYEYKRDFGASITGGETLKMDGKEYYLFADFVSGKIAAINLKEPSTLAAQLDKKGNNWTTFGKSPSGEVYIANIRGDIYRITLE